MSLQKKYPERKSKGQLRLSVHVPLGLELIAECCLREDRVSRETADTACSTANSTQVGRRDATPVTSDAACIAHVVCVLELLGRCEVEVGEGIRLAKRMTAYKVSV
jgi:hypothetical protein